LILKVRKCSSKNITRFIFINFLTKIGPFGTCSKKTNFQPKTHENKCRFWSGKDDWIQINLIVGWQILHSDVSIGGRCFKLNETFYSKKADSITTHLPINNCADFPTFLAVNLCFYNHLNFSLCLFYKVYLELFFN